MLVSPWKGLCYSNVNGMIQHIQLEHVSTTNIKSLRLTIPKDMDMIHLLLSKIQDKFIIYLILENANQIGEWWLRLKQGVD